MAVGVRPPSRSADVCSSDNRDLLDLPDLPLLLEPLTTSGCLSNLALSPVWGDCGDRIEEEDVVPAVDDDCDDFLRNRTADLARFDGPATKVGFFLLGPKGDLVDVGGVEDFGVAPIGLLVLAAAASPPFASCTPDASTRICSSSPVARCSTAPGRLRRVD